MEHPVVKHTELLTRLSESTKSAHKRLDDMKDMMDLFHNMNNNLATIANETKNQGLQLIVLVETMGKQGVKIEDIEKQMETKETVGKLEDRIEEIEKQDGVKAEKLLGQIKWLLISLTITAVFGLVWMKMGGPGK